MESFTTHHWITYLNKRKERGKKRLEHEEEEEQEELCIASMDQPLFGLLFFKVRQCFTSLCLVRKSQTLTSVKASTKLPH